MMFHNERNHAIQKGIEAVYALNADTELREKIKQRDSKFRKYFLKMQSIL